jgi:phosphatidylglycerol:prolipoprotein diacylglycerol transferase
VQKVLFVVPGVGLKLYSFSVMMLVACFAALWLTSWRARREKIDPSSVTDLAIWLMGGGFIGARVFYIVQQPETIEHLWDVFKIWQGGIVYYGCIVGGLIGSLIYWARHPFPFWAMADAVAPALALGEALGRVGCLLNGCCYGLPCRHPWAIQFPSESLAWFQHIADGTIIHSAAYSTPVHPTQIYSVIGGLLLLGLLSAYYPHRRRDGEVMALLMVTYPVARFVFESYRGDEPVYLAGLTMSQGISVIVFLGGLALWYRLARLPRLRHADGAGVVSDDLPDELGPLDADQLLVEPVVEVGELVGVEAHLVQDRGV